MKEREKNNNHNRTVASFLSKWAKNRGSVKEGNANPWNLLLFKSLYMMGTFSPSIPNTFWPESSGKAPLFVLCFSAQHPLPVVATHVGNDFPSVTVSGRHFWTLHRVMCEILRWWPQMLGQPRRGESSLMSSSSGRQISCGKDDRCTICYYEWSWQLKEKGGGGEQKRRICSLFCFMYRNYFKGRVEKCLQSIHPSSWAGKKHFMIRKWHQTTIQALEFKLVRLMLMKLKNCWVWICPCCNSMLVGLGWNRSIWKWWTQCF